MDQDLEKLYDVLKNGNSHGLDIKPFFEGYEKDHLQRIYNRSINEGFARTPTVSSYYTGKEIFLQLTQEGKQYPSYQVYFDRHKKQETSISNSIFGNHNTGNNVGQDFEIEARQDTNTSKNPVENSRHEVKMAIAQFIFWLFSALAAGITIGFTVANNLHK
jgi:hypothetical protein